MQKQKKKKKAKIIKMLLFIYYSLLYHILNFFRSRFINLFRVGIIKIRSYKAKINCVFGSPTGPKLPFIHTDHRDFMHIF